MVKFIERLVARGHSINNLAPIIMGAAASLDHPNRQKRQNENQDTDTIYIHWEYHPYGVQRKDIRDIYRKTLEPFLDYDKMTVAISRPKNLRDILTKAALTDALSEDIDYFLTNGRQQPP